MYKKVFLISFAIVFLFISFGNLARRSDTFQKAIADMFPTPTPAYTQIKGIGVIGDSLSDEYQGDDNRGFEYAPTTLNWVEQLVKSRGVNFGMWNTWGDVRRTGFEYNWSRTGATTTAAILNGQHTGLAEQVADGEVNFVIIFIGANDFFPFRETYNAIYSGTLTKAQESAIIDKTVSNVETIIDTIQHAGKVHVMLVTIPDWNMSAAVQLTNQNAGGRSRVSTIIDTVNTKYAAIAQKRGVAIADANAFYHTQLADAPLGSIVIGNQNISLYIPGDEPHHAFLSDAIHPGTVMSGLFANYIIDRMDEEFHTNIRPLSDQEIEKNAGLF